VRNIKRERGSLDTPKDRRGFLKMLGTGFGVLSVGGLTGCYHLTQTQNNFALGNPAPLQAYQFTNEEFVMILQDAKTRWRNAFKQFLSIEANGTTPRRLEILRNRIRDARTHTVVALRELKDSRFEREINKAIEIEALPAFVEDMAQETIDAISGSYNYSGEELFVHSAWSFSQDESRKRVALANFDATSSIITQLKEQIKEFKAKPVLDELTQKFSINNSMQVTAQARGNCLALDDTSYLLIGAASYLCDVRSSSLDCSAATNLAQIASAVAIMGCTI
jgi:hypothetical protein